MQKKYPRKLNRPGAKGAKKAIELIDNKQNLHFKQNLSHYLGQLKEVSSRRLIANLVERIFKLIRFFLIFERKASV
jgi:hypothetical protein